MPFILVRTSESYIKGERVIGDSTVLFYGSWEIVQSMSLGLIVPFYVDRQHRNHSQMSLPQSAA